MPRAISAGASLNIPRMVPWRDWDEWHRVKALLFSPDSFLRCQGVRHVAAWRSRQRTPHAVETTSQLVEVRLNDVGPAGCAVACPRRSEDELRLTYSTVVIRAVNGLTGHEQKTAYATPVSVLARDIGLPTWLVDIRHEASHKQLPGLVILRLAADFLIDYLWRRYWTPQTEHLSFLWRAFDQLISRFKAASEVSFALPSSVSDGSTPQSNIVPHYPPKGKRKRKDFNLRDNGLPADSTAPRRARMEARALAATGLGGETSKGGEPKFIGSGAALSSPAASPAASQFAAHEIAFSATPTALSWALVSLLADGGGTVGGDECNGGMRGRRQGHLLPRSRERYPTPRGFWQGSPGADEREIARRVTSRWASLLNIFHERWEGFGAALLVRLVEALLHNASLTETGLTRDVELTALAGGRNTGSNSCSISQNSNNSQEGQERQSAFIFLWTRHLLSRRWHLRSGDPNIRESLKTWATDCGLSRTFCQNDETSWDPKENAWVDEPAPPAVLSAAFFPLKELRDRCHRMLATLPAAGPECIAKKIGVGGEAADAALAPTPAVTESIDGACDGREHPRVHWARVGLHAICDAFNAALSSEIKYPPHPGARSGAKGDALGRQTPGEFSVSQGDSVNKGRVAHGALSSAESIGDDRPGTYSHVSGSVPLDTGYSTGNSEAMMDLDALERFLRSEQTAESLHSVSPDTCLMLTSEVSEMSTGDRVVLGKAAGEEKSEKNVNIGKVRDMTDDKTVVNCRAIGNSKECDGDWELVEDWTPCAIGTLPGWSATPLY